MTAIVRHKSPPGPPQLFRIRFDQFHWGCFVMIGDRAAALPTIAKVMRWPTVERDTDDIRGDRRPVGETFVHRPRSPLILIPRYPVTPAEHGTLAHEASHVAGELMHHVGIKLDRNSDEVLAHAVGYIVRTVLTKGRR